MGVRMGPAPGVAAGQPAMALSQLCWVTGKSKGSVSCWSIEWRWQWALGVAQHAVKPCWDWQRLHEMVASLILPSVPACPGHCLR